jgi:hypothetical protein
LKRIQRNRGAVLATRGPRAIRARLRPQLELHPTPGPLRPPPLRTRQLRPVGAQAVAQDRLVLRPVARREVCVQEVQRADVQSRLDDGDQGEIPPRARDAEVLRPLVHAEAGRFFFLGGEEGLVARELEPPAVKDAPVGAGDLQVIQGRVLAARGVDARVGDGRRPCRGQRDRARGVGPGKSGAVAAKGRRGPVVVVVVAPRHDDAVEEPLVVAVVGVVSDLGGSVGGGLDVFSPLVVVGPPAPALGDVDGEGEPQEADDGECGAAHARARARRRGAHLG